MLLRITSRRGNAGNALRGRNAAYHRILSVAELALVVLGDARLHDIATQSGIKVDVRPVDAGQVFPVSGGLPLPKRAPQAAGLIDWRPRPLASASGHSVDTGSGELPQ